MLQIYYGDGKGKTTAAFGLALRCAGWGQRAVIAQFLKSGCSGEVTAARQIPKITVLRLDGPLKFTFQMNEEEKTQTASDCLALFRRAVEEARSARLLVLDEVIDAAGDFLPMEALFTFLDKCPEKLEVVLTGHSLPQVLAERADYITRMDKERHPYDKGVQGRREIEF